MSSELLDEVITAWNELPKGIGPRVQNRKSRPIVKGWEAMLREPEARVFFQDVGALMDEIVKSKFLHGKPFFKFQWLFCTGNREFNVVKIMEGRYHDRGMDLGCHRNVGDRIIGAGQRFDESAEPGTF